MTGSRQRIQKERVLLELRYWSTEASYWGCLIEYAKKKLAYYGLVHPQTLEINRRRSEARDIGRKLLHMLDSFEARQELAEENIKKFGEKAILLGIPNERAQKAAQIRPLVHKPTTAFALFDAYLKGATDLTRAHKTHDNLRVRARPKRIRRRP